jgi:hypothetical protein
MFLKMPDDLLLLLLLLLLLNNEGKTFTFMQCPTTQWPEFWIYSAGHLKQNMTFHFVFCCSRGFIYMLEQLFPTCQSGELADHVTGEPRPRHFPFIIYFAVLSVLCAEMWSRSIVLYPHSLPGLNRDVF